MHGWLLAASLALATTLLGCQTGGNTELLEHENRQLCEDITQLQLELHDKDVQMQHLSRQVESSDKDDDDTNQDTDNGGSSNGNGGGDAPLPKVDMGEPTPLFPDPEKSGAPPSGDPPAGDPAAETRRSSPRDLPTDRNVYEVTLDPEATGGHDSDPSSPGDDGLMVVVEPRNKAGQLVPIAGEITVSAWDTSLLEQFKNDPARRRQAHVGMWKLNPSTAAAAIQRDAEGPKIFLQLKWPAARPRHDELRIYVRFRTADGRQLVTDSPVGVLRTGSRPAPRVLSSRVLSNRSLSPLPASYSSGRPRPAAVPLPVDGKRDAEPQQPSMRSVLKTAPQPVPAERPHQPPHQPASRTATLPEQPASGPQWKPYR